MAKMLTKEEWDQVLPPFTRADIGHRHWPKQDRDIIQNWIDNNCNSGWVYHDGSTTYVFESSQDLVMLRLWLSAESMAKERAKLTGK